ncbi:hypothetical protein F5890DRAFT_360422 [Lentinula detonsa]|uniref:Uncharacterized protein n=1 Tax=Lentinula detonsa TaxID=2804962 RepID=A0AA38PWI7_9AGAR|nr:hypothetical protein F5890DRAFT_360422 [Lentinula detonsa]
MRFGLFRRFSYLIHRRTRSDSALLSQTTQTPEFLPSSLSLDGVQQQRDPSATRVIDTVLPPAPVLSPLLPNYIPPYSEDPTLRATANASALSAERSSPRSSTAFTTEGNFNEPLLRLSAAQKHVAELAAQSSHLKASLEALRVESGDVEGAINKAKNDLGLARSLANCQKRTSADLELKVNAKRHELAQFQAFAQALSEVNLVSVADTRPGPVTSSETTDNANHFEEKAVEAIRKASSDDASIWSKIISLVIGPRAPENYVNAINMTLQARQELLYWRKVSNFWKKTARESSTNAGAPTPSTSNLSEIRETLSDERKKAVQDLREKRKTIGLDATCNIPESSIESLSSINAVKLSYRLPDSQPSFTSAMSTMSIIASNSYSPITKTTNRLPPLASDIFKQDLLSSHSSQRLFSTSSHKALWTFANTQAQVASNPSDKALGKSKAIEFRDSVASMPSAGSSSHSNISQNG